MGVTCSEEFLKDLKIPRNCGGAAKSFQKAV